MVLIDDLYNNTEVPSFIWRSTSHQVIVVVAAACRAFLYGFNRVEVNGLPNFLELLKSRSDYRNRRKGLLTVSNHISVLDDPLIWGVLPLSFTAFHGYLNFRWTLGSHDLCFKNAPLSHFFTLGQVFPTHRCKHSEFGGPDQPVMTEAIRIMSRISATRPSFNPHCDLSLFETKHAPRWPRDVIDPLSNITPSPYFPSCPNDVRYYFQPSRYACNSYSWIHIFPEGFVHQSKDKSMRYFKWGVARLILESPECPDIVPMFIEGTDKVMPEDRTFPRFLPRVGNRISITFGNEIEAEAVFGDLRERYQDLKERYFRSIIGRRYDLERDNLLGFVPSAVTELPEAIELRIECTKRIRDEVLKLRRSRGYPDEDPKNGLAETWWREGTKGKAKTAAWVKL